MCPGVQRTTSMKRKFHRQNCINHFRSATHCQIVASLDKTGDAVATAVTQQKLHVFSDQLPVAVVDDAIIAVARKSLPLTTVVVTLDVCQRALNSCNGDDDKPLSTQEMTDIRKACPRAASRLIRLAALTKRVKTSHGVRGAIRRGRTAITNRMYKLSRDTLAKKVEFLLSCRYLGLTADESDTYSFSAPLAAALQGCSPTFQWASLFMGQVDVVTKRDGAGLYAALVNLATQQVSN